MPVSLVDRSVVIVGASSGMGRAAAVLFAREGAKVIASARRESRLAELQDQMAGEGFPLAIYPADAANPDAMRGLAQFVCGNAGPA
jgi:short-subunit dehydrogenase